MPRLFVMVTSGKLLLIVRRSIKFVIELSIVRGDCTITFDVIAKTWELKNEKISLFICDSLFRH